MTKKMCMPGPDLMPVCAPVRDPKQVVSYSAQKLGPGERLIDTPEAVELGEQSLGSRHRRELDLTLAPGAKVPFVTIHQVAGDGSIQAWTGLNPNKRNVVNVQYSPTNLGVHWAMMQLSAHWEDGYVEKHYISFAAKAVTFEEASVLTKNDPEPDHPDVAYRAVLVDPHPEAKRQLSEAEKRALAALQFIGSTQLSAVEAVQDTAKNYIGPPDPLNLWALLAKEAVSLAVSLLTMRLGPLLISGLGRVITELGGGLPRAPLAFENPWEALGGPPRPSIAESFRSSKDVKQVLDAAAGGLKRALPGAIVGGEAQTRSKSSADSAINFFTMQKASVAKLTELNAMQLARTSSDLTPMLSEQPDQAVRVMKAIELGYDQLSATSAGTQLLASSQAWAQLTLRNEVGMVAGPADSELSTTNLTSARDWAGLAPPERPKGLLDIEAELVDGHIVVTGARIDGISRRLAQEFLDLDLRNCQMPIRIIVGRSTFITIDEAKRIRLSGALWIFDQTNLPESTVISLGEPHAIRGAKAMVDEVVGKSLHQWKIAEIVTDDAA